MYWRVFDVQRIKCSTTNLSVIRTDSFRTSASCSRPSVCGNMFVHSRPSVRKGARTRIYSTMRDEEEDRLERVEQLKRSKAELIGTLRKT